MSRIPVRQRGCRTSLPSASHFTIPQLAAIRVKNMRHQKEVLLTNNRRAAAILVVISAVPALLGMTLAWWARSRSLNTWAIFGAIVAMVGLYQTLRQAAWLLSPRLALVGDEAWVYLDRLRPIRVPLEFVECFFIGQAPSQVKVAHPAGDRVENVTVVVRLADRAKEWKQRTVNATLGRWCDGYITINGDWCEPLNGDVVNQINRRLVEYKRRRRAATATEAAAS